MCDRRMCMSYPLYNFNKYESPYCSWSPSDITLRLNLAIIGVHVFTIGHVVIGLWRPIHCFIHLRYNVSFFLSRASLSLISIAGKTQRER